MNHLIKCRRCGQQAVVRLEEGRYMVECYCCKLEYLLKEQQDPRTSKPK